MLTVRLTGELWVMYKYLKYPGISMLSQIAVCGLVAILLQKHLLIKTHSSNLAEQ